MRQRVKIGTCSGPAEAAFVRSVFDAHELAVVINGEMHAGVMGGLAGFVRLDILVDRDDAEDAIALLRDIRAGDHAMSDDDELPDDPDGDERADAAGVWDVKRASAPPGTPGAVAALTPTTGFDTRHRRTGAVLLLSVIAGFGTAHMSTGAWKRGAALALVQIVGIAYAVNGHLAPAGWLLFAARFGDLFGALWRVWSQPGQR